MIDKEKSLAYKFPELVKEWHPTKNGELTPHSVMPGSGKKVWWICNHNHEWEATISNRTGRKSGCPYCSGKKAWLGFNDLQTTNPTLAKEWHPTKNKDLTPRMVVSRSDKKVWWLCEKGHEWKAAISGVSGGSRCPICSGHIVLAGYNDLTTTHPDIAEEWHPILNGELKPQDVSKGSTKLVWWQCANGHEWKATPNSRTDKGSGCPFCARPKK